MFGKLLKYDFRSMWKQFAFIWPAALALAVVNHFTMNTMMYSGGDGPLPSGGVGTTTAGVAMTVYVAILMAMFIIALVFAIQRFYKGLLGDEGYLMHTLPVRPWQLIGAKLLCAVATTFLSVVVAILSVFIILPWGREDFRQIFEGLEYLFSHWNSELTSGVVGIIEFVVFMLISIAAGFLQLYLSMSIGHLFNKNRVALSVVAFIAINAAVTTLMGAVGPQLERIFSPLVRGLSGMGLYHRAIWIAIVGELLFSAACFAGTEYILRRRLNLE